MYMITKLSASNWINYDHTKRRRRRINLVDDRVRFYFFKNYVGCEVRNTFGLYTDNNLKLHTAVF